MNPVKIYGYLMEARERIFDAVRALSPEHYSREFHIGLKTLGSTITHAMIVEWSYMQRIRGETMPPYDQWPIQDEHPPAFDIIERTWRDQAIETRATLETIRDWSKEFSYIGSRPQQGHEKPKQIRITVTPADVFTQMIFHEVHHRAQVMAMLRELGKPIQDLDYAYFGYKREELS